MTILGELRSLIGDRFAIDLGTANTLIYTKSGGIILDEPSVVALNQKNGGSILAVGRKAKDMYGRTGENIKTVRPMKDGVIADFDVTQAMIRHFIKTTLPRRRLGRSTMMACVPSGVTSVEMKAVIDSAIQCGAGTIHLIEEPMAAAIGSRLPINEVTGSMVVDIGGGTTEVAVISRYAIAYSESLRVAGDEMDEAIRRYVRREHGLAIGPFEAERVKIAAGSAWPLSSPEEIEASGIDVTTGIPRIIKVTNEMTRTALEGPVKAIVEAIRKALAKSSPELAADITRRGIVLAGGGSLLKGLGPRLHAETGLAIYRAKDPLTAVVRGTGYALDHYKTLKQVCLN